MAKNVHSGEKGKMTFVFFQLEGSDETLQQGFKAIEELQGRLAGTTARGQLPGRGSNAKPALPANSRPTESFDVETEDPAEPDNAGFEPEGEERNSGASPRLRSYPTPEILNVDLTQGDVPFRAYFERMGSPDEDNKRYLLVATWFKEHKSTNEITSAHIYTCYKFMDWKTQRDVAQPLRKMKQYKWFNAGKEKSSYEINHIGLDC